MRAFLQILTSTASHEPSHEPSHAGPQEHESKPIPYTITATSSKLLNIDIDIAGYQRVRAIDIDR